jgi:hypothetical protein
MCPGPEGLGVEVASMASMGFFLPSNSRFPLNVFLVGVETGCWMNVTGRILSSLPRSPHAGSCVSFFLNQ